MAGTGEAKKAILIMGSKRQINVKAYDEKYNPNAEGHSDITTDKVLWHTTGLKEYSVDVEMEVEPGSDPVHPSDFDQNNPVDLVIIDARERRRYVQGICTDEGYSFKEKETEKHTFTLGLFKDRIFE